MWTEEQIKRVAKVFAKELRSRLGPINFTEMCVLNAAESDPMICHSHDYCDANQVMIDVCERMGLGPDLDDSNIEEEETAIIELQELQDKAWSHAKRCSFNIGRIKQEEI